MSHNYRIICESLSSQLKESFNIFDFESKSYIKSKKVVKTFGRLVSVYNDLQFFPENLPNTFHAKSLVYLATIKINPYYYLHFEKEQQLKKFQIRSCPNSQWIVISDKYFPKGYLLNLGDILKIGKCKYLIKKMSLKCEKKREQFTRFNKQEDTISIMNEKDIFAVSEKKIHYTCRICLNDDKESINIMISPCKCTGTIKFVHLKCIKYWLNSKIEKKDLNSNLTSYKFNRFECELCKNLIPDQIKVKDRVVNLIEFEEESENCLIIESLKKNTKSRSLYKISLANNNEFIFGRDQKSHIPMQDSSVSMNHCKLKILDNQIFVEDLKSKYGTLIQTTKSLVLLPYSPVSLQVNSVFVNFLLIKKISVVNKFVRIFCRKNDEIENCLNGYRKDYNLIIKESKSKEKKEAIQDVICFDENFTEKNEKTEKEDNSNKEVQEIDNFNDFLIDENKQIVEKIKERMYWKIKEKIRKYEEKQGNISDFESAYGKKGKNQIFAQHNTEKFFNFFPKSKLVQQNLEMLKINTELFEIEKMQYNKLERLENLVRGNSTYKDTSSEE